ncbi:hypothetical protein OROMI_008026 [Orobanche minor]
MLHGYQNTLFLSSYHRFIIRLTPSDQTSQAFEVPWPNHVSSECSVSNIEPGGSSWRGSTACNVPERIRGVTLVKFFMNDNDKTEVEYRIWNPRISKLAAAILSGLTNIWLKPGSRVLYVGSVCGITVLQLSDLVGSDGVVYVKGLSDDVANTVEERSNVIIISGNDFLHKDYRMVVGMVDVILGDIVYPEKGVGQLQVIYISMQARSYLRTGGHYLISTRPKNNNLTSQIKDPFADCDFLSAGTRMEFKSKEVVMLEPIGRGHVMVVGGFRMSGLTQDIKIRFKECSLPVNYQTWRFLVEQNSEALLSSISEFDAAFHCSEFDATFCLNLMPKNDNLNVTNALKQLGVWFLLVLLSGLSPWMAGLLVKLFVWFLELRMLKPILLYMLKRENQMHKFVSFVELEDPPLYVPLHPYEEHREPEAKYLESDLTPSEQVQKAIKCIDSSESKQENKMISFRHWIILEYSRAFLSREITPNMVADKFIASVHQSNDPALQMSFFISCNEEEILRQANESTLRYERGDHIIDGRLFSRSTVMDRIISEVEDDESMERIISKIEEQGLYCLGRSHPELYDELIVEEFYRVATVKAHYRKHGGGIISISTSIQDISICINQELLVSMFGLPSDGLTMEELESFGSDELLTAYWVLKRLSDEASKPHSQKKSFGLLLNNILTRLGVRQSKYAKKIGTGKFIGGFKPSSYHQAEPTANRPFLNLMPSAKNPRGISSKSSDAEEESSKKRKRSVSDSKSPLVEKKKHKKASKSKARGTVTDPVIIKDVPAVQPADHQTEESFEMDWLNLTASEEMESAKIELSKIAEAFSTLRKDLKEAFAKFQQLEEQLLLEEQSQLRTVESKTVAVLEYTDFKISDHDAKIHAMAKVISSFDEKLAKFEEQQDNVLKVLRSIDHTVSVLNARKGEGQPNSSRVSAQRSPGQESQARSSEHESSRRSSSRSEHQRRN